MTLFTRGLGDATREHKPKRKWECYYCHKQCTRKKLIAQREYVICRTCEDVYRPGIHINSPIVEKPNGK